MALRLTKRKKTRPRAELAAEIAGLRISEIRYRRLFEAAHDGVLLIDPDTCKIVDANPYMTNLLEYSHAELIGKELFEIGLLSDKVASQNMFQNLTVEHFVRFENMPLLSKNGRHQQVEIVANLYDENDQPIVQCNIRDISERRNAEEHDRLMMAEVNHRSMNLLAVVQAVIHQTSCSSENDKFVQLLIKRIHGLSASQDLLVKSFGLGVDLEQLVKAQLAHFKDLIGTRVLIDGPSFRLTPAAAQSIGMVLHELATNAGKYGALSNLAGQVNISWHVDAMEPATLSISWMERGGPVVIPPTRTGFGRLVVGRMVEAATAGSAIVEYAESGFSWALRAPIAETQQRRMSSTKLFNPHG